MMPESTEFLGIRRYGVVRKVPRQYLTQLCSLFRNRVVPVSVQFFLDFPQCGLHPITTR